MSTPLSDFGVVGLAVMGQNLARNVASRGYQVSVYNRTTEKTKRFVSDHGKEGISGHKNLREFVASLKVPRKILIMVRAGSAVDTVAEELSRYLEPGDIMIDGGNSFYQETIRRETFFRAKQLNFFGCGVSGGEKGALEGPSLMPGGNPAVWNDLKPIMESIAAKDFNGQPCVTYLGTDGAGHFVKMVHNGIEYAVMQMLAEAYQFFRDGYRLSPPEISKIFKEFQSGPLESYLLEIAVPITKQFDELTDEYLLDFILDKAGQKGTGRWTAVEGFSRGSESSIVGQAVNARVSSSQKKLRESFSKLYPRPQISADFPLEDAIEAIEKSLYSAIMIAYAQGFELIQNAAEEQGWKTNLAEVSRIWQGGCIIRAKVLETLTAAFTKNQRKKLLEIDSIREAIIEAWPHWRKVVSEGVRIGIPFYCLGSALTSFESLTTQRTSANFIQGLRDCFGAHTYERTDRAGSYHTQWDV